MTKDELKRAGKVLYGDFWQSEMEKATGIDRRAIRRWAAGDIKIPLHVESILKTLTNQRVAEISELKKEFKEKRFFLDPESKKVTREKRDSSLEVQATVKGEWVLISLRNITKKGLT